MRRRGTATATVDLRNVVVPQHQPILDAEGAAISPSPLLIVGLQVAKPSEIIKAMHEPRMTRRGLKRLELAERAGLNRSAILIAIQQRMHQLPEVPERDLRIFDGAALRAQHKARP